MDYSALIGPAVVAAVASGPRKNKRLLWVTTVICLALGGCAKRGSPASVAIEIVLQIACLGLLVFTIFRLRKTHAHQIYIIWYIFFLGFVPFFWIFYAIISPDRHLDWAFGESGDKLFHFAYQYLTDFKALDESRPLACFAGIWTNWTSVRKVKEGETTNDLYAFLTTEANAEVYAIHPKAMPVILRTPDEVETWMTAPAEEALKLQRPLPNGTLRIVARGVKDDAAPAKAEARGSGQL